jgi:hypothetical protein
MHSVRMLMIAGGVLPIVSCSDAPSTSADGARARYASDVTPITRVEDARPGVFIPPFVDCRPPLAGDSTTAPGGKVCTNVAISGATEADKAFEKYGSCDVVRTQRPYWPAPHAKTPDPMSPRLADAGFAAELAWAKAQVAATGCACCHDNRIAPRGASQWDISVSGNWLDTVSDGGLALFAGLADSTVLGAYPPSENHGFDRTAVGLPSTDVERMTKLMLAELTYRGITEEQARGVPPFGGPIYENAVRPPTTCAGEGVAPDGRVVWRAGQARYVYVLEAGSRNPGVPPNLDRPEGTLWRLDVLANAEALENGFRYGTTPDGSFQVVPAAHPAPALDAGNTYQLTVLRDVGVTSTNCLFVYGEALGETTPPTTPPSTTGSFGGPCTDVAACGAPTDYCLVRPGQSTGYCTRKGCNDDASVCPSGWSCFDLAQFDPASPAVCLKP